MKIPGRKSRKREPGYLEGQLLVAMPLMTDKRFSRSVIYLCAHSEEGAMGLIVNQRSPHISFTDLLHKLNILPGGEEEISNDILGMSVHLGGPVDTGRGFVLHSGDYFADDSTVSIGDGICLTATVDILKSIAAGDGPDRSILALGYAGWSPGQLESEIQANGWLNCPADPDLVFETEIDEKYDSALSRIGVTMAHLVNDAGHA